MFGSFYRSAATLTLALTLIKTEYWDRAGGVVPMLLCVLGWRKVNWLGDGD